MPRIVPKKCQKNPFFPSTNYALQKKAVPRLSAEGHRHVVSTQNKYLNALTELVMRRHQQEEGQRTQQSAAPISNAVGDWRRNNGSGSSKGNADIGISMGGNPLGRISRLLMLLTALEVRVWFDQQYPSIVA